MSRIAHLALLGVLLPASAAHAGPPMKNGDGGFSVHAWFTRAELDNLGVDDTDEAEFCGLMQDASNRLFVSSEGMHYIQNATFMVGENQPGIRFFAGAQGEGLGNFHGRLSMPLAPGGIDESDRQTLHHELGHYLYGFADEYLKIEDNGFGFCADYTSSSILDSNGCTSVPVSTCASGAECIVPTMCDGGLHHGQICVDAFVNGPLFVHEADCEGSDGECLAASICLYGDHAKEPCTTHEDCGNATQACSGLVAGQVGVDRPDPETCIMADLFGPSRWCADNHQHTMEPNGVFPNGFSLDQSLMIDALVKNPELTFTIASDYSCWDLAEQRYADLSFPGDYRTAEAIGLPPQMAPEDCVWAIDPIEPDGSTAILIDTSGSMQQDDAYQSAADGARFFYDEVSPDPNEGFFGIYGFDSNFIARPYPIDMVALDAYMEVQRTTHMCAALEGAAQELAAQGLSDRKIVVLTDGRDNSPPEDECYPVQTAADLCNNQGISVHAIAYGAADVATTQAMTQAGCGVSKLVGKDTPGMSKVHALQLGFARMSSSIQGEIELLYQRQDVAMGHLGEVVGQDVVVPEAAERLTLTWMGDNPYEGMEPPFNQASYTVFDPAGMVYDVQGDTASDRARYRSIVIDDPMPGVWAMIVDGTTADPTAPIDVEVGWLATIDAPSLEAEAWVLEPSGVVGQYTTLLASASMGHEPLTGLIANAEVYIDGVRLPLPLYDDGQHGDMAYGDGVYGARFMPGEEGAHGVDVTFTMLAGETRSTQSRIALDEDYELRADTSFQASGVEPVVGLGVSGAPLELPDLVQGSTVTGLQSAIWGVPVSPVNTTLSLGPGIDIQNVVFDCISCGSSNSHMYQLFFDVVVDPDAATGPRDLIVQNGATWHRLEDATQVLTRFKPGELVITEVMAKPATKATAQWFEVHNPSLDPVDLQGLAVENHAGDRFVIDTSTPVPAEGLLQVFLDGITVQSADDSIGLRSDGELVDVVGFSKERSPTGYGVSMNLDPTHFDAIDNDDTANWCASIKVYDAFGQRGTPGKANTSCGAAKKF